MIARVAAVAALFALPLLALAGGVDSCNTGDIQCCNSFQDVSLSFFRARCVEYEY